jgi:peptidoglycan-associated lipoprotein
MANSRRGRGCPLPWLLAAATAVFFLAGCPDQKPKGPACNSELDCKDGLVCVEKQCVQCQDSADCPKGKHCRAGACIIKPECSRNLDCDDGKVCQSGKCSICTADSQCGPGGRCTAGACLHGKKCGSNEDCADDEDCVDGYCQKPWKDSSADANSCSLETVYFGFDEASVGGAERQRLDANASCLEKTPSKNVTLYGHTDDSGTDEYNIALSERRAQSVADYLARLGVDPARMTTVPKGETEITGASDEKDRRVEFQWR